MKNSYEIVWTKPANDGFIKIIEYIKSEFGIESVIKFNKYFNEQLERILLNPKSFPFYTKSKNIKRALVAKLTSIYFIVDDHKIVLISVIDNRQKPIDFGK